MKKVGNGSKQCDTIICFQMSAPTVLPSSLARSLGNGSMQSDCLQRCDTMMRCQMSSALVSAICACAKGGQWHHALGLFVEMRHNDLLPNVMSYNSGNNACEKGGQWHHALGLFVKMRHHNLLPDDINSCLKQQFDLCVRFVARFNAFYLPLSYGLH